jgi:hypothetical protein
LPDIGAVKQKMLPYGGFGGARNQPPLANAFKTPAETVRAIAADPRDPGVTPDGRWVTGGPGFLLSVHVLFHPVRACPGLGNRHPRTRRDSIDRDHLRSDHLRRSQRCAWDYAAVHGIN